MDRAYANALKKRDELELELAEINSFLRLYEHFSGAEAEPSGPKPEQTEPLKDESLRGNVAGKTVPRKRRRLRPPEIADLAEKVIRSADEPLTRAEIAARLVSAGIELRSEDKARYVGTILWREKRRFRNIPGRGYVMTDMRDAIEHDKQVAELLRLVTPEGRNDDEGQNLI